MTVVTSRLTASSRFINLSRGNGTEHWSRFPKCRERQRQKTEHIIAERGLGKMLNVTWISHVYVTFFIV